MKTVRTLTVALAGFWFWACAHTVTPEAPQPPPKEPVPQEAPQKTSTSRASSQTTESEQKDSGQKTDVGRQTTPAADKLEEARENLRISQATEKRIASELKQLKQSGKASPEAIKDYESYHQSVQQMVAENRKIVERMEAAYNSHASDSNATVSPKPEKMFDPTIPEEQTVDEVAALDRELNHSLAEFDEMLLKEMDAIRNNSTQKMNDLAKEAAQAAKRLREKGIELDTSASETSGETEESSKSAQKGEPQSGRETDAADREAGADKASREKSRKEGSGPSGQDRRRADYEDDDIVARQLREAAENETDPELKAKLWKEYEEYKKNR